MLLIMCLVLCIIAATVCTFDVLMGYPRFANWLAYKEVNHIVGKANRWYRHHGISVYLMTCESVAAKLDQERREKFIVEVLQYNPESYVRDSIIADCTIIHEWYVNGTKPSYLDHDGTYDSLQEHLPNVYGAREHYFHYYTHHEDYRWNGIFDRLVIVTDSRKYSRKRRFYKYMVVRSVEGLIPLMKQTECMKEFNNFYKEKFGVDVNGE